MSMVTYVLIAAMGIGTSGKAMVAHEFHGEAACENAANTMALQFEREIRHNPDFFKYICEPKSAVNLPKEIR